MDSCRQRWGGWRFAGPWTGKGPVDSERTDLAMDNQKKDCWWCWWWMTLIRGIDFGLEPRRGLEPLSIKGGGGR
jgi:hypothetical protein